MGISRQLLNLFLLSLFLWDRNTASAQDRQRPAGRLGAFWFGTHLNTIMYPEEDEIKHP